MESEFQRPTRAEAASALSELGADRERLAESIRVPWPLLAGFGAVAAYWVGAAATAAPGEGYEPPASGLLTLALVLLLMYLVQRKTGVRFRSMGFRAALAVAGIAAACLVLFSTSLGLVSLGLPLAVLFTSAAAFGVTTWLAAVAYRSAAVKLRHG